MRFSQKADGFRKKTRKVMSESKEKCKIFADNDPELGNFIEGYDSQKDSNPANGCSLGLSIFLLAGAFLAPFMLGLYMKGITTASVWACFAWGVGLTVINMLMGNPINPIDCGAIAMLGGFPVVILVSLFTPRMASKDVEQIFECYRK